MSRLLGNLSRWLGRLPTGWWVAIAIVPALVPLVHGGFFESADGRLHLDRLAALDQAVRAGVLLPRWFPDLAFGYGHPVLNFYGPLSYYLALPFTLLGASPIVALKLVFAAALVGSGLGMLLLARRHLDRGAAAVAAIVYVYLPYHLLDVYVRGAVAETLTFAWLPLILWSLNRLVAGRAEDRQHFTWLSGLLTAALVITHSLSAVLVAPVLAAYVVLLLVERRDARALGRMTLAMVVGLGASAFHWLPIAAEARYVGLGYGTSQGYQNHLLPLSGLVSFSPAYDYTSQAGAPVTYPLGLMQAALMIAGLAAACWPGARRWLPRPGVVRLFGVVGLVSAFMVTTASLPVWRALEPVLAFLQYPWRFELLTVLGTAVLAGALAQAVIAGCKRWGRRIEHAAAWTMVGVLLVATVGASLWQLPFVPVQPDLAVEEMWRLDRESGQVGTTWTGEYLPIGVTEQRWAISRSATELAPSSSPDAVATMAAGELWLTGVAATRYRFSLGAPLGTEVVLHQFYYPGWQARWQGQTVPGRAAGSLGLAAFDLGPGVGQLDVRLAHTPAQLWGTLISAFILLAGGVLLIARFWPALPRFTGKTLLFATGCLVSGAVLLAGLVMANGYVREVTPVNANLENSVELLAYLPDRGSYHPGDTVQVTLYWRALRPLEQDYKAFVHLTDAAMTRQPAQHDGDPGAGYTPTTRWLPGEVVADAHSLRLPADLPPGRYRLWAGMYQYENGAVRNLAVEAGSTPDVTVADNRILLGEVEVVER